MQVPVTADVDSNEEWHSGARIGLGTNKKRGGYATADAVMAGEETIINTVVAIH